MSNDHPDKPLDSNPSIKSDDLSELHTFFQDYPGIEIFTALFQITVIIDANIIISDLIWLTQSRNNPKARTALQEVIAADTLVAVAPEWLEDEIQENIPEVSEKENIPKEKLLDEWNQYRKLIDFKNQPNYPINLPNNIQDPDDMPYLLLQNDTGHVIYSQDSDLDAMGAKLIDSTIIMTMRDYSRYEAIELQILSGSLLLSGIGIETIKIVRKIFNRSFAAFSNLPGWAKFLAIAITIVVISHPYSRKIVKDILINGTEKASNGFYKIIEVLEPTINDFKDAQEKSNQNLADILDGLPYELEQEN